MARFEMHLGANYDPNWICILSDKELAEEIRKTEWDPDLCYQAAEALGVTI